MRVDEAGKHGGPSGRRYAPGRQDGYGVVRSGDPEYSHPESSQEETQPGGAAAGAGGI